MLDVTSWRTCRICGETKPLAMFYRDMQRAGENRIRRRYDCRDCARKISRRGYEGTLKFLTAYKLEAGCADCGYNAHAEALDFDHLPGTEKKFTIANNTRRSQSELMAEIAKCEVVCANCHRVRTKERREFNSGESAYHDLRRLGIPIPGEEIIEKPFEQLQLDLSA